MKKLVFWLVNESGATMHHVESTSFRKARRYFAHMYEGRYKIVWRDENKQLKGVNVRL